jgi:hypothetical protein
MSAPRENEQRGVTGRAEKPPIQPVKLELSTEAEQRALFDGLTEYLSNMTYTEARYPGQMGELTEELEFIRGVATTLARSLGYGTEMPAGERIKYGLIELLTEPELEGFANDRLGGSEFGITDPELVEKARHLLNRKREENPSDQS